MENRIRPGNEKSIFKITAVYGLFLSISCTLVETENGLFFKH